MKMEKNSSNNDYYYYYNIVSSDCSQLHNVFSWRYCCHGTSACHPFV